MFALLPLLLLPAYNLEVMAGAPEAVLDHKVTLRMEPNTTERGKPGSFLSRWSNHTSLRVLTSGHLLCEKKKNKPSILLSHHCLGTKQMQLEIEENFPGLKGDNSPLSEGQAPFLIMPYSITCW